MIKNKDAVGIEVKKLRKKHKMTGQELADQMDCSQSLISKIESGKIRPSNEFITKFAEVTKLSKSETQRLQNFTNAFLFEFCRWGHDDSPLESFQSELVKLEHASSQLRVFSNTLIDGLLQTEEYMRYIYANPLPFTSLKNFDKAIKARIRRQKLLQLPNKSLISIHNEAVFGTWFFPPEVMTNQIEKILELRAIAEFEFRILPLNQTIPLFNQDTFVIFDKSQMFLETMTMSLIFWEQIQLDYYENLFARLMDASVSGKKATSILERYWKLSKANKFKKNKD